MDGETEVLTGAAEVDTSTETGTEPDTSGAAAADADKQFNERFERQYAERSAKDRRSWEEQHLNPVRKQYEDLNRSLVAAELARMKAMGWVNDAPPKALTQEDVQKMLGEQSQKQQQQMTEYIYSQRINGGWREVSRAHPKLAPIKGFQDAVLARFAETPQRDFAEVGAEVAKDFETFYAARATEINAEHAARKRPDRMVVPSGRGAGAGGGGEKGEKRQTVSEKILARLGARE